MAKINLLIVDDNNTQASGLKRLFGENDWITLRAYINSPENCLERIEHDKMIDIILLDVMFPESNTDGIQLTESIRDKRPYSLELGQTNAPKIIFFSVKSLGYVDIERGIHGLISKNKDFHEMVDMIKMVHFHGATFPPEKTIGELPGFWGILTAQERKIFCMVVGGKSSKEIAKTLKISEGTPPTHRKNILEKLRRTGINIPRLDDPRMIKLVLKYKLCPIESLD